MTSEKDGSASSILKHCPYAAVSLQSRAYTRHCGQWMNSHIAPRNISIAPLNEPLFVALSILTTQHMQKLGQHCVLVFLRAVRFACTTVVFPMNGTED